MIFDPNPGAPGGGAKKSTVTNPDLCEYLAHQIWLDFVQWLRR